MNPLVTYSGGDKPPPLRTNLYHRSGGVYPRPDSACVN
ncbi:hypothetical protein D1AOALGA4SA_5560 [Olavius algarvensis Delta 1 endosymbiont]|nr:hypothetical protein D1AOALGA4SA_5560 [Olavius algarvensis Delta 1 endosymbiont]